MKELNLNAEIVFFDIAEESFNFPICNSIRLSFWLPDDKGSTFSEIIIDGEILRIGEPHIVQIRLLERDHLKDRLNVGAEFSMGVFPTVIAKGKILGVKVIAER